MRDGTVTMGYDYDPATRRLSESYLYTNTDYQASQTNYTRDQAGKITSAVEQQDSVTVRTSCYTYDGLSRLTQGGTAISTSPHASVTTVFDR